jgi:hypothetical protein|tara:strand:+ start:200 stop:1342 length:1143 start_codon:yes stop_codon:yes gene_type:complete
MDLPFIEFKLTDDVEGLQAIALVDRPAIGVNYQAFDTQKFEVINEEQRIVMGAAMIPNLPIYRRDERGEYYAVFKKDTIKALVQKYFKESKQGSFNEQHDQFKILDGVYVYQSFITDEKLGISAPRGFDNIADGTWFIAAKVENDEAWAKVKEDGLLKGFSVEGIFDLEPYKFKQMNKINLESVISTLKSVFADAETEEVVAEEKFGEGTLVDGTIVKWEGELVEGAALAVVMPEGEVAAPDGIHELADGTVIETAGGLVVSITALEAANEDEVENEFTAEQLSEMLEKAMSKYAEAFTATLETIKSENETLRTELSEIKSTKEELKNEFSETLRKVGEDLEELAKSESATAKKPQEFKATTRAEKAARMGAIIRANNLK